MRTTAIMNLKGGTAKTITAINTAAILSKIHGNKVLLVDADSQGNLSEFTAANPTALPMAKGSQIGDRKPDGDPGSPGQLRRG